MDAFAAESSIDLLQLTGLKDLQSLAIIGLSKNAGKTTCLNHIVAAWQDSAQARPLALTSIGRDGESEDVLSGYEKPRIYIPTGTLIASAEGALQRSDALLEILELSNIRTAFGEVIVCRALSDGYVELAGPSATEEMRIIENLMRQNEPNCLFIIDGALSRRSQAGSGVSEAVFLCVSVETSTNPEILADRTSFALNLLQTPALPEETAILLAHTIKAHPKKRSIMLNGKRSNLIVSTLDTPALVGYGKDIANAVKPETRFMYLKGAMTDQVIQELLSETNFTNLTLVVEDGTRLFIKPGSFQKLHDRKVDLAVLNPMDVRLVCLNPTCANGQNLDSQLYLAEMRKKLPIPVVDLGPRTV
jgi:hypothetical protein